MQRALTVTALAALCCAACATMEKGPTDTRLLKAEKIFEEGQRFRDAGVHAEARSLDDAHARRLALTATMLRKERLMLATMISLATSAALRDRVDGHHFLSDTYGITHLISGKDPLYAPEGEP